MPPTKDAPHTPPYLVTSTNMVPVPDPTALTSKALEQSIAVTEALQDAKRDGLRDTMLARMASIDATLLHVQSQVDDRQKAIKEEVSHLAKLHEEKFDSIDKQFQERDTRTDKTAELNQKAIDAALQAAKEAVNAQQISNALSIDKSEKSTTKQIDQITLIIGTMTGGLNDKIDDLKARLTTVESYKKGGGDAIGWVVGAIGLVVAVAAVVIASISLMKQG